MRFEYVLFAVIAVSLLLSVYFPLTHWIIPKNPTAQNHNEVIEAHSALLQEYIDSGRFRCCLKNACHSCLIRHKQEDEIVCDCLDDVVQGEMPCGECAGGILKGYGNYYLRKYFAKSLSDGMGEEFYLPLKGLMFKKYGIELNQQA